jgi:hypothetical protein
MMAAHINNLSADREKIKKLIAHDIFSAPVKQVSIERESLDDAIPNLGRVSLAERIRNAQERMLVRQS